MDQETECAQAVEEPSLRVNIQTSISKIYYRLTIYLPRPIPTTIEEFMSLKDLLIKYYGLEDRPDVWFTVASQMTAGSPFSVRRSYVYYVNIAKRLPTNRLVKDVKEYFDNLNSELLKEAIERLKERASESAEPVQPTTEQPL